MNNWITCLSLAVLASYGNCEVGNEWTLKKLIHRPRTLSKERLQTLCDLSNMSKFKSDELQPFMKPRISGTPGNREVQEYIIHQLQALNWSVDTHTFEDNTPYGKITFNNIIGTLNTSATRRLVLACHFDSKYFEPPTVFIGATDSAVPCAMMLDLIRLLDPYLKKPKNIDGNVTNPQDIFDPDDLSILDGNVTNPQDIFDPDDLSILNDDLTLQLIFFDGEEAFLSWTPTDSLYGSRKLAEKMEFTLHPSNNLAHTTQLDGIDLFVLLDLIGAANPHFYSFFKETAQHFTRFVGIEKRLHQMNCLSSHIRDNDYFMENSVLSGVEDDHIPFLRRGVRILHLIPTPFPSVWHTAYDNEQALDFTTIDNLSKILRVFVAEYLRLRI